MDFFYAHTGNYGIAIILLTVITKVLFFPLTIKSMTSMKRCRRSQPQINAIRSKYKNDAQKLQQEDDGALPDPQVNPLGGCLPMIVQIPIFYALYVALSVSVELQSQPFICFGRLFGVDLWICDLAATRSDVHPSAADGRHRCSSSRR
jgi:YidC/Oxa1 family membrane protein insertase